MKFVSIVRQLNWHSDNVHQYCPKGQELFAFRRLNEKQKTFSAYSAARATLSNVEGERAVSLCLKDSALISMTEFGIPCPLPPEHAEVFQ